MGKAGRAACVFVPMVLTLATLAFLIMIGLGSTNSNNSYLSNLYFLQINTTAVTGSSAFAHNAANDLTPAAAKAPDGTIMIQNFYTLGLWNYCGGAGGNTTRSALAFGQSSAQKVDFCAQRALQFGFDFKSAWGLSGSAAEKVLGGDTFAPVLLRYQSSWAKWMSTLYILACVAAGVEVFVALFGLCSRLGGLFTTLSALVTTAFATAFAALVTAAYFSLGGAGNVDMTPAVGISFRAGATMYVYMWLACACSLVAALFWAFSSCCCSGRERSPPPVPGKPEPYTYARVADGHYGGSQAAPNGYQHVSHGQ